MYTITPVLKSYSITNAQPNSQYPLPCAFNLLVLAPSQPLCIPCPYSLDLTMLFFWRDSSQPHCPGPQSFATLRKNSSTSCQLYPTPTPSAYCGGKEGSPAQPSTASPLQGTTVVAKLPLSPRSGRASDGKVFFGTNFKTEFIFRQYTS